MEVVTVQVLMDICRMQYDTNTKMAGTDWLTNPLRYNYVAAEYEEKLELLRSAGWQPFWRKGDDPKTDLENCHMELVDILHFRISRQLQEAYRKNLQALEWRAGEDLKECLVDIITNHYLPSYYTMDDPTMMYGYHLWDTLYQGLQELYISYFQPGTPPTPQEYVAVASIIDCGLEHINDLLFVANYFGLDQKTLFAMYIAKNALNHFRTNNGYKDGTYQKEWHDGKEDNFYVMQHVKDSTKETSTLSWDSMYQAIGTLYKDYTGHEPD